MIMLTLDSARKMETFVFQKGFVPPETKMILELSNLIEQHFKDHKDSSFYAIRLNKSIQQINKALRFYNYPTIQQCLQIRTYKEAVNLLKYTNMSIKEVAYELQMSEPAYFTRWFKRNSGYPPFVFRSLHRK